MSLPVRPDTVGVFGPSTAFNFGAVHDPDNVPTTSSAHNSANSPWAALETLLGGRARLLHNTGVSGQTSAQIRSRVWDDVRRKDPQPAAWILLEPTGNDASTYTLAEQLENLRAIVGGMSAVPGRVVVGTPTYRDAGVQGAVAKPGGGNFTGAEYRAQVEAIAAETRRLADRIPNVYVAESEAETHDPATHLWLPGYSADGVHPRAPGAYAIAKALAPQIEPVLTTKADGLARSSGEVPSTLGLNYFLQGGAGSNEVQLVNVGGATGGTYTLTIPANSLGIPAGTTAAIAHNESAASTTAKLEAVLGAGNVAATGSNNHFVTFQGALAARAAPLMTMQSSLTGTTSQPAVTRTIAGGVAPGWAAAGPVGLSIAAGRRSNIQGLTFTGAGAVTLSRQLASGALAAGAAVYAEAELFVDALVDATTIQLLLLGQAPIVIAAGWGTTTGISPAPGAFPLERGRHVLRTPPLKPAQTLTNALVQLAITAGAGTKVAVGRIGWRRVSFARPAAEARAAPTRTFTPKAGLAATIDGTTGLADGTTVDLGEVIAAAPFATRDQALQTALRGTRLFDEA